MVYHRQGKYEEAETNLMQTLALDPTSIVARNELGNMYITLERYDDALKQFKLAMKHFPQKALTYHNLGNCYLRMGKVETARRHFERRIQLKPEHALSSTVRFLLKKPNNAVMNILLRR